MPLYVCNVITNVHIYMQTQQLEQQISILEKRLSVTPELIRIEGRNKYNPSFFALKAMIKNKKIELNKRKQFQFLAQ